MENHYVFMIITMILSGLLSAMYIWAYQISDIRLTMNDIYMIFLMTGWMLFFMTFMNGDYLLSGMSFLFVVIIFISIRKQLFITKRQYFRGMIPHHSMAVLMSERLLENDQSLSGSERAFVQNIIKTQRDEIDWMKTKIL